MVVLSACENHSECHMWSIAPVHRCVLIWCSSNFHGTGNPYRIGATSHHEGKAGVDNVVEYLGTDVMVRCAQVTTIRTNTTQRKEYSQYLEMNTGTIVILVLHTFNIASLWAHWVRLTSYRSCQQFVPNINDLRLHEYQSLAPPPVARY